MKIIKIISIFLLLTSSNIGALEIRNNYTWKVIGEIEGRVTSVDLNNIEESEGNRVIFVRFSRPNSNEIEKSFYRKYLINCNSSEFTTAASISFDGSDLTGKIINNVDPISNLKWTKATSGTVGSTYIETACNGNVKINKPNFPLAQNVINSAPVQQQAATTSNTILNGEWIKDVEFNGSKPGIRVHLLYGRMKRDGDLLQVSNLYNFYPNALGDENAKESAGTGLLEASSSPARSRLITEIINCKSSTVATINDDAYSRHWAEGRVVLGAFSSKVVREPGPFAKANIDFYKNVCSISNLPQDKSLAQQWRILESNSVRRTAESLKWNQFICDGKYTQITKNIVLKKDASAQAGFAYSKSNDRLLVELAGVYDRMAASTSEIIPNFSTSAVNKSSSSVSGFYRQTNSPVAFNTSFDIKGQRLQITYSIGGIQTIFEGKCRSEEFL
jgi:hypothetical protein